MHDCPMPEADALLEHRGLASIDVQAAQILDVALRADDDLVVIRAQYAAVPDRCGPAERDPLPTMTAPGATQASGWMTGPSSPSDPISSAIAHSRLSPSARTPILAADCAQGMHLGPLPAMACIIRPVSVPSGKPSRADSVPQNR